jgi:hypothetical protein
MSSLSSSKNIPCLSRTLRTFDDFSAGKNSRARYYRTAIVSARPGKPRDKAKMAVQVAIRCIESGIEHEGKNWADYIGRG